MFANLYRECLKVGLNPLQADELEIWQIAVALGADRIEVDDDPDGIALLKARVRYEQGLGPKPEARPMDQSEAMQLAQSMMGAGSF